MVTQNLDIEMAMVFVNLLKLARQNTSVTDNFIDYRSV